MPDETEPQARILGPLGFRWCNCEHSHSFLEALNSLLEISLMQPTRRDLYQGHVLQTIKRLVSGKLQKSYDFRQIKSAPNLDFLSCGGT